MRQNRKALDHPISVDSMSQFQSLLSTPAGDAEFLAGPIAVNDDQPVSIFASDQRRPEAAEEGRVHSSVFVLPFKITLTMGASGSGAS
jgi:hypothetical protein